MLRTMADNKHDLVTQIVQQIKDKILEGSLKPGERIVEIKLAKELGISQTPIREAIRQLAGEGIVTIVLNRGAVIRSLSAQDVFEIYSLRSSLEGLAIRLAVQNATMNDIKHLEAFYREMERKLDDDSIESLSEDSSYIHRYILKLSKHELLEFTFQPVSFRITWVNRILGRSYSKRQEVEEHRELIEALQKRDPDEAERIMRAHIHRSYRGFLAIGLINETELTRNEWI